MGGAQAIFALAYGTETDRPRRRGRRAPATPGCGRRSGRLTGRSGSIPGRPLGADGRRRPRHRPEWVGPRPLRPGRARGTEPAARRRRRGAVLEAIEPATEAPRRRAATASRDAPLALVAGPRPEDAIELANAFAPEHLELSRRTRRCSPTGSTHCRLRLRRPLRRDRLRRLRRRLQPRPADRRRRALLGPARPRRLPPLDLRRWRFRREAAAKLAPHVSTHRPRRGIPGPRRVGDD